MNVSTTKAAKNQVLFSGSADSLIGFWTGIDHFDGSTIRLSISCDDSALTNECEVMYSDDYWGTNYCDGMGLINQLYTLSSSGSLTADKVHSVICADGEQYTGFQGFNEYVPQSNGSLMWYFYSEEGAIVNQHRFWYTASSR